MNPNTSFGELASAEPVRLAPILDLTVARRKRKWDDGMIAVMIASLFTFAGLTITLLVHPLIAEALGASPDLWFSLRP